MSNIKFTLTREQVDFLKKIQKLDADINCNYTSFYDVNIKHILASGYYNEIQQDYMRSYLIPDYKNWKKQRDRNKAKSRTSGDMMSGMMRDYLTDDKKWKKLGYWEDE